MEIIIKKDDKEIKLKKVNYYEHNVNSVISGYRCHVLEVIDDAGFTREELLNAIERYYGLCDAKVENENPLTISAKVWND